MTLLRSTKEVDYFTQLVYEALEIIEKERQQEKTKENVGKIKLQGLSQKCNIPERNRTIFNLKSQP